MLCKGELTTSEQTPRQIVACAGTTAGTAQGGAHAAHAPFHVDPGRAIVSGDVNIYSVAPLSRDRHLMEDSEDRWPLPNYNPGPSPKHLHALGVISILFSRFQSSVEVLFLDRAESNGASSEIARRYYFNLSEDNRIDALKIIFASEQDDALRDLIYNLIEYYGWCQHCRNQLLHSEYYPPAFGSIEDEVVLSKRVSRSSSKTGYIRLSVRELRSIADKIRAGLFHCAGLHLYMRYKNSPKEKIPVPYRVYVDVLPEKLEVPQKTQLALTPQSHARAPPRR